VLLVSDYPLVRMGLAALLAQQPQFAVAVECGTAREAREAVQSQPIDIVVLDLSLRSEIGLDLVRDLRSINEDLRILVTSVHEDTLYAGMTLNAGAMAYVNKNISPDEVVRALREVTAGHIFLSPHIAQKMLGKAAGIASGQAADPLSELSEREFEIFERIGRGWTTRRIANHLQLSVHTIETYRERLRTKLGIKNSVELSFRAIVWVLINS
jgi:DNA-binding NarL/FixJ family response regulator